MEIANTNDENSFDPTPRLKPSPIPIKFISFNWKDKKCVYCGEYYTDTILGVRHQYHYIRRQEWQQYCQKCLSHYIKNVTHINMYSDVYMDLECKEHKIIIEDASIIVLEGVDADFLITSGEDNWTSISILDNDLVFVNLDLFS
ncbi:kinase-like domain-containing protein [Rhizophagus irregularis DAOM 181602=DAOM 197198]|nr:kinase-like domain-containing protein [Rhizophagus irregularis DAOM 181602=DAOM 197198]